jgi:hypothetical protein
MCCVITAVLAFIVWLCPGALARMFSNDPVGVALESRSHPYSRGCFTWYAHASFCALHVPLEQQRHPSCGGQRSSAAGALGDALVYCVGPPTPILRTAHRLTHLICHCTCPYCVQVIHKIFAETSGLLVSRRPCCYLIPCVHVCSERPAYLLQRTLAP